MYTYKELCDELGQYKLLSLTPGRGRQHVRDRFLCRALLLCYSFQVSVKPYVTRQLEALVLGPKWPHALVGPHCPQSCNREVTLGKVQDTWKCRFYYYASCTLSPPKLNIFSYKSTDQRITPALLLHISHLLFSCSKLTSLITFQSIISF